MSRIKIPYCYFPTTVVLVDHDPKFCTLIADRLAPKKIKLHFFNTAQDGLNCINQQTPLELCAHISSVDPIHHPMEMTMSYQLSRWYKHIEMPERHDKITVLALEQELPDIPGLELCMHLQQPNIKVILLSQKNIIGQAISALNEGLIHQYIPKSDDDTLEKLEKTIIQSQIDYFINATENELYDIPLARQINTRFADPAFCDFFEKYRRKKGIIEYYLLDFDGDILMRDEFGKFSILVMKSEETMKNHHFLASRLEKKENLSLFVEKIKQRSHVLFLTNTTTASSLMSYLHPADRIDLGEVTYYYSIIEELNTYSHIHALCQNG